MKKILLVEDDVYIVDIYKKILTEGGYEVDSAITGLEGQKKVQTNSYDVILLDIMLPGMDGMSLLKEIRNEGSLSQHTPVFMLTNLGQEDIIGQSFGLGAQGYLIKAQVKPQNILSEINSFLSKAEQNK